MFGTSTINPIPASAQVGLLSGEGHQSGRWGTVNVANHNNQNQLPHSSSSSNAVVSGQRPVPGRSFPDLLPKPAFQQASLVLKATEQRNHAIRETFEANKKLVRFADEVRTKVQNKVQELQQQVEVFQHHRANITPQALNTLYRRIENLTTLTQSYGQVIQENTDCVRMLGEAVERLQEAKIHIRNQNEQISDLRGQAAGLQGEKQGLEKSLKEYQSSLFQANKKCSELNRALTESQAKGADFESLVKRKVLSIKNWQAKHDGLVRYSHELKADLGKLQREHNLAEKEKTRFQSELQSINTLLVQAEDEVAKLKDEVDNLKRNYNQAVEQHRIYESEQATRINCELNAAKEKLKSKDGAIKKLDAENFRLMQDLQDLEDHLKNTQCKQKEECHSLETHYLDALNQKDALIHTTIAEKNELQNKLQKLKKYTNTFDEFQGTHLSKLERKILEKDTTIRELENEKAILERERVELMNSHKQMDQLTANLQQAQQTNADLQSWLDAKEREISACNETINQQTGLIDELKEVRLQTTVVVEALNVKANSLMGEFQQLRGDIEINSKNANEIRSQMANLSGKLKELMAKDDKRLQSCIKDLTAIQENLQQYDKDNERQVHRINSLETQTSALTDQTVNLLQGGVTAEKISSRHALPKNLHENRASQDESVSDDQAYSVHMRFEDVSSEPSSPSSHMVAGMSYAGSKSVSFKNEVPLEQEIREYSSGNDDGMNWELFASSDAANSLLVSPRRPITISDGMPVLQGVGGTETCSHTPQS